MKYFFVGAALWMCAGCTTLENRRDLYSPDPEFYPTRSTTTVTRETTTERGAGPVEREERPGR